MNKFEFVQGSGSKFNMTGGVGPDLGHFPTFSSKEKCSPNILFILCKMGIKMGAILNSDFEQLISKKTHIVGTI